jgi:hypothetical protein
MHATGSHALTNEQAYFILCTATEAAVITKLGALLSAAGVTPGAGVNRLALFTEAGVQAAVTGDMTTAFESTGFAEGTITPYTLTEGANYYLMILTSFTGTVPSVAGPSLSVTMPALNGHYLNGSLASQATVPASITPSGFIGYGAGLCMYGR